MCKAVARMLCVLPMPSYKCESMCLCEHWACVHIPSPYLFSFLRQSCFFFFMLLCCANARRFHFKKASRWFLSSFFLHVLSNVNALQLCIQYGYEVVNHVDMIIAKKVWKRQKQHAHLKTYTSYAVSSSIDNRSMGMNDRLRRQNDQREVEEKKKTATKQHQ